MWTTFWDMHSGGDTKEPPYEKIYIEAPKEEAKVVFYRRFGHSAERVSCTYCGGDYSISEDETLAQATAYHRGCTYVYFRSDGTECPSSEGFVSGQGTTSGYTARYVERADTRFSFSKYLTLEEYLATSVLVIYAKDITAEEREGDVPEQGYVWKG